VTSRRAASSASAADKAGTVGAIPNPRGARPPRALDETRGVGARTVATAGDGAGGDGGATRTGETSAATGSGATTTTGGGRKARSVRAAASASSTVGTTRGGAAPNPRGARRLLASVATGADWAGGVTAGVEGTKVASGAAGGSATTSGNAVGSSVSVVARAATPGRATGTTFGRSDAGSGSSRPGMEESSGVMTCLPTTG
jgi:hypothetical protein